MRQLRGLSVSAQGFGCLPTTAFYGRPAEADAISVLRAAIDAGVTLFDTADVQGIGTGERLLGRAIAGRRDHVVIATKFGMRRSTAGVFEGLCGEPAHVHAACDRSLRRLGTDHLDLYYQHWIDPLVPVEDTAGAVGELIAAGKVRHFGLSEPAADSVRRADAECPVTAVQSEWSLWSREIEADVLPTCRELGIGVVAYAPLGRGLLAGAVRSVRDLAEDDFRRAQPRFAPANLPDNVAAVRRLGAVAAEAGVTVAQLALAWLHRQGEDVVPIPGTHNRRHLAENLAVAGLSLADTVFSAAERAVGDANGLRYAPAMLAMTGR
ncbi:MAG TPA: aldo/keto reductase [Pseudonocardiaceae bacterium]|nr:aldo/keto reductase [Pseudonocardiaceae bacterium]